jgi:hypothetical protein
MGVRCRTVMIVGLAACNTNELRGFKNTVGSDLRGFGFTAIACLGPAGNVQLAL